MLIFVIVKELLIKISAEINDNKKPPKTPEYVLFGLILVNFGPLNIFPNKYPPISVDMQVININKKMNKLFSLSSFLTKYTE